MKIQSKLYKISKLINQKEEEKQNTKTKHTNWDKRTFRKTIKREDVILYTHTWPNTQGDEELKGLHAHTQGFIQNLQTFV